MGAIAVVFTGAGAADHGSVERMLRSAPHRGSALNVQSVGAAAFGVSNDPSFVDSQIAVDNGWIGVFTGALDNRAELEAALTAEGDPAGIVLAAFRKWGTNAPARFRGIFAGAVSDGRRLWCFRDHIGFCPLFFRADGHAFLAASEAKQVVSGAGISREPDVGGVEQILFGGSGRRTTALRGVERFPSSSVAVVDRDRRPSFTRYWDPAPLLETARLTPDEAVERLRELLEQAVRRAVTGVDAVSLSGGLDSPAVAAFAAPRHHELSGRSLRAVSAVYPNLPAVDERRYVELVSERLGLDLHTYVPGAKPLDDLASWVDMLDGPVDTVSVPELAEGYRAARAAGARTVLTGELAEYVLAMNQHVVPHLLLAGRWGAASRRLREERRRGNSWPATVRPHIVPMLPRGIARRYAHLRGRDAVLLPPWIDLGRVNGFEARPDLRVPARRRWAEAQLEPTGRGVTSPTLEADALCAAAVGVHVRRPFTDVDLWEFLLSLRAETKFPNRVVKVLLRRAMAGLLPAEILWRRDKTAFDDHIVATADWPELERWILRTPHRIVGVDYRLLGDRLSRRELSIAELKWARDVAQVHAFLSRWD